MSLAQIINKGPSLAELLRRQGRGKDSILAHINPREAAILRRHGGSGRMNPRTGLPEFDDTDPYDYQPPQPQPVFGGGDSGGGDVSAPPVDTSSAQPTPSPDASASTPSDANAAVSAGFISDPADYGSFNTAMDQAYSNLQSGGGGGSSPEYTPDQVNAAISQIPITYPGPGDTGTQGIGDTGGDSTTTDPTKQSYGSKLLSTLTQPSNLAKIVGGVGVGALGLINSNKAAKQATQQAQQISNLGAPFSQQGNNILQSTLGGALTPGSAQTYQANQAKLAQDAVNRGGVGAQQNIAIAEGIRQQLLQSQFTAGLNLIQIGNSYVESGIKESIVANQQVNAATQNFYASLFKAIGSIA